MIVDAIFGTGFDGEPRGAAKDAIEAIAVLDAVVVSADIASGVDASTGEAARRVRHGHADGDVRGREGRALDRAGQAAHGRAAGHRHRDPGGSARAGRVGLLTPRVHALVPGRREPGTKFTSGHVVVAGGSRGLTGAPCLACEAAMRAGAGYVTAFVPRSLERSSSCACSRS